MKKISLKKVAISALLILNAGGFYNLKNASAGDITDKTMISSSSTDLTMFNSPESLTTEQTNAVHKYAPVIFQETRKNSNPAAWDFITSYDFDGDLKGSNNEASLKSNKYVMPATIYYSLVESETHYFIVYSLFHPLDWDTVPAFIPFSWHENDMENVQVVIRKKTDKLPESVILLSAQAHLDTEVSTISTAGISSTSKKTLNNKEIRLLSEDLTETHATHPGLYVEPGGHGIYNMNSNLKRFSDLSKPKLKEGFTFIPSTAESNVPDVYSADATTYRYQLKSIYDNFWTSYQNKANMGNGKLMDGSFSYKDELVSYQNIPRHFDSSRLSGPGKSDSGILPFAFSYSLGSKDLGSIFFNPAKKYSETLKIEGEWSKKYTYNPYIKDVIQLSKSSK